MLRAHEADHPSTELVTLIVPTRDQRAMLERLVESLARTLVGHRVELLVVDNGGVESSTHAFLAELPKRLDAPPFERVEVLRDDAPFNYSRLNNRAAALSRGEFLCLLNDDIEAIDGHDWLGALLAHARLPGVGCVGAKLLYPDDTLQHAGVALGPGGVAGHSFKGLPRDARGPGDCLTRPRTVSAVTAACLLVRRSLFEAVGGFDERLPVAWNDVDLCLRIGDTGHENRWTPAAELYHHESVSRGRRGRRDRAARRRLAADVRYMRAKWPGRLDRDPLQPAGARADAGVDAEIGALRRAIARLRSGRRAA